MGVEFDTCDTCGETTCENNIRYMNVVGLGSYKTCSICMDEKYFELSYESKEKILQEKSGYFFVVCKRKECPTNNDICFFTTNIEELKAYIKEEEEYLVGCTFENTNKIKDDVYFHTNVETMLSEAYDVLLDEKKERVLLNCDFEIQWEASEKWKKIMIQTLDDKIECLKIKRRKFK